MKKFNKFMSLLLVAVMMLSLVACGGNKPAETQAPAASETPAASESVAVTGTPVDPYADLAGDYDAQSSAVYDLVLGEFNEIYSDARSIVDNLSERYAKMAIAEAKLMESGVMLPLTVRGGNYAMSRAVPYSATTTLWGNDQERLYQTIVATELLKNEDRDALKAMWAELRGTGTWIAEAKKYMTEHGYTLKDSYAYTYVSDPQHWDVLATSQETEQQVLVNTFDGLLEYNTENVQVPALAESYEVSEDGLTYTFHLRQGVKWVDSQGREVADVKADDFVAGMQHMMDAMGGLEYLVQGVIVNADKYISGEITDFSQVGVKAVDDYTLQYTLVSPSPYFLTMLGYSCFAPMSRSFYESKGGKFGAEYDNSAASYTYGKTKDDIAYCGPFTVTNATAENTIVFKQNPTYWNKDAMNITSMTWLYDNGKDPTKRYNDAKSGTLDGAGLNASSVKASQADGLFETNVYASGLLGNCFPMFVNVNRNAFANANDGAVPTTKNEDEILRTRLAMYNQNFRLALAMAVDRAARNAQRFGEDLKLTNMVNSYTPGNFVSLPEEVTVDINGTATTFPAGTYYGAVMQAQLDADGLPIKVWDPAADGGIGSSGGFDGWYNPEAAAAALDAAIAELAAQGVEVSAEKPIYLELPTWMAAEEYVNQGNAYKQSVESVLGGKVVIVLTECATQDEWQYSGYYTNSGDEANFDICDLSGWGPDYGDPQTYLDTMLPDYAGYMTKQSGMF